MHKCCRWIKRWKQSYFEYIFVTVDNFISTYADSHWQVIYQEISLLDINTTSQYLCECVFRINCGLTFWTGQWDDKWWSLRLMSHTVEHSRCLNPTSWSNNLKRHVKEKCCYVDDVCHSMPHVYNGWTFCVKGRIERRWKKCARHRLGIFAHFSSAMCLQPGQLSVFMIIMIFMTPKKKASDHRLTTIIIILFMMHDGNNPEMCKIMNQD